MLYLKNWFKTYFGFTKREYNGLLGLIGIIIIVTLIPYIYEAFFVNASTISSAETIAIQKLVLVDEEQKNNHEYVRDHIENDSYKTNISYFNFDPNQIELTQWQKLGLSLKQAQSIINYRNKGGKFYKPEDLQKMYAISPQKYKQLLPYITIDNNQYKSNGFAKSAYIKKELQIIEINTADTLLLDEIKGVGAAFARRIAKYRDRLGGFYKKEQLLEVYGLDSVKFAEIKDQIKIDLTAIKKININTAEFQDLRNNPYLNYKQINAIIQYRKQHGSYNDVNDLCKIFILNPQTIQNLTPYLSF